MGWSSESDSSEFYAFEPERFLIPPMEGFLRRMFGAPWGLILVSGPANINLGTIFSFLANFSLQQSYYSEISTESNDFEQLEKEKRKLVTIEEVIHEAKQVLQSSDTEDGADDPEEREWRSHFRRNSDIIFIKHLSPDVVSTAVENALTGNLVAAGIRAESSFTALKHLQELVPREHLVAASLMGIIALNTVNRICPHCKIRIEHQLTNDDMILFGQTENAVHSHAGAGCKECNGTGYKGRILIHEGFETSSKIRTKIMQSLPLRQLRILAKREGMETLLDAAWSLVNAGETTLDEVTRIAEATDPGGNDPKTQ